MSIRFSASRSVDERRRRRLAQATDVSSTVAVRAPSTAAEPEELNKLPRGSSPADSLIPAQLWKHFGIILFSVLTWGAVLLVGDRTDRAQTGLEGIIGLSAGKLTTFFSTVMLLAAGQLSLIMLWYRSRSRKDFSGSYKLWFWTAVSWLVICAFRATGAHWILADAVLAGHPIVVWNARLLVWLIPASIMVLALSRLLSREMRDCALSLWALRLSSVSAAVLGTVLVLGEFVLSPRTELIVTSGVATLWHLLLAISMLLHTRHVIHETNEPPQSPVNKRSFRLLALRLPQFLQRSGRKTTADAKEDKPAKAKPKAKAKRTTTTRKSPSRKPATSKKPPVVEEPEVIEDEPEFAEDQAVEKEVDSFAEAPEEPVTATSRRIDPPAPSGRSKPHFAVSESESDHSEGTASDWSEDDEDESGRALSKKERKRLKKLNRARS